MPKIRDLGITVLPESFGPNQIGGGGGCGCTNFSCSDCTNVPFSICGTTPGPGTIARGGGGCTDCTQQAFSICGTTPGTGTAARAGGGCSDCTRQNFSICGTTPGNCTDCTQQAFSICGTSPGNCTGCTQQAFTIGPVCTDCTHQAFSLCGGTRGTVACFTATIPDNIFTPCGGTRLCGGTIACGGSIVDPGGPFRVDQQTVVQLKQQLQQRLAELEAHEKTLGPQTHEEIDARETEIKAELDRIKSIRKDLGKK